MVTIHVTALSILIGVTTPPLTHAHALAHIHTHTTHTYTHTHTHTHTHNHICTHTHIRTHITTYAHTPTHTHTHTPTHTHTHTPHTHTHSLPAKPVPPPVKTLPVGSIPYDLEPAFKSTSLDGTQPDNDPIPKPTGLNDQPSVSPPPHPHTLHTPRNLHVHVHYTQTKQLGNLGTPIFIPNTRPGLQTPSKLPCPHPVVAAKDDSVDGQEPLQYRVYRDHVVYHGTDRCQTANGREVYSYLEPDVAENARLRQAFEPSLCPPDFGKLGFPKNLHASYHAWYSPGGSSATLIYSSQVWGHAVVLPECWMC